MSKNRLIIMAIIFCIIAGSVVFILNNNKNISKKVEIIDREKDPQTILRNITKKLSLHRLKRANEVPEPQSGQLSLLNSLINRNLTFGCINLENIKKYYTGEIFLRCMLPDIIDKRLDDLGDFGINISDVSKMIITDKLLYLNAYFDEKMLPGNSDDVIIDKFTYKQISAYSRLVAAGYNEEYGMKVYKQKNTVGVYRDDTIIKGSFWDMAKEDKLLDEQITEHTDGFYQEEPSSDVYGYVDPSILKEVFRYNDLVKEKFIKIVKWSEFEVDFSEDLIKIILIVRCTDNTKAFLIKGAFSTVLEGFNIKAILSGDPNAPEFLSNIIIEQKNDTVEISAQISADLYEKIISPSCPENKMKRRTDKEDTHE